MKLYRVHYVDEIQANPRYIGYQQGWDVYIKNEYKNDAGLLVHEVEHVAQFWVLKLVAVVIGLVLGLIAASLLNNAWLVLALATVGGVVDLHSILYKRCRWYKLYAEASAYSAQRLAPNGAGGYLLLTDAAVLLSSDLYGLGLTREEAVEALYKYA